MDGAAHRAVSYVLLASTYVVASRFRFHFIAAHGLMAWQHGAAPVVCTSPSMPLSSVGCDFALDRVRQS